MTKYLTHLGILTQVSKLPVGFFLCNKKSVIFQTEIYIKFEKVRTDFPMEGLVGFEPTIRELQSHALPLGYRPTCIYIVLYFIHFVNKLLIKNRPLLSGLF